MKKLAFVVLCVAGFAASVARADDYENVTEYQRPAEFDHPFTPALLSLATPVQVPSENYFVQGLRLNLIYGTSYRVYGLDAGLVGHTTSAFKGLSVQFVDWVEGPAVGAQVTAFGNVVGEDATGFQSSAAVNYTKGTFTGVQLSSVNYNAAFYGLQFGAFNWNKSLSYGLQFGVSNANVNEFNGWSLGAINWADAMSGLQIGCFNIITTNGRAVQIGVINAASSLSGLQVGLLNLIGDAPVPVLPVVNAKF